MPKKSIAYVWAAVIALTACRPHYSLTAIEHSRILVDKSFDGRTDERTTAMMEPYRQQVDSIMAPVIGTVAGYLWPERPESNLSNLLADILVWSGPLFGEHPDFSVYNIGAIRAALAQGPVTIGNVLEVSPFDNKVCFLTLTGEQVVRLFGQIAGNGGEGVSRGVELVITPAGRLLRARLDGQPLLPTAHYRIATTDYVAQGNDKMEAFKQKKLMTIPQEADADMRHLIMRYFREQTAQGKTIEAQVEGRITIQEE